MARGDTGHLDKPTRHSPVTEPSSETTRHGPLSFLEAGTSAPVQSQCHLLASFLTMLHYHLSAHKRYSHIYHHCNDTHYTSSKPCQTDILLYTMYHTASAADTLQCLF